GASAYLNRQYTIIAGIGAVIAVFLTITLGWKTGVLFVLGAVLSGATGYVGMNISVRSNLRTAEAARGGIQPALKMAFRGDAVTAVSTMLIGSLPYRHNGGPLLAYVIYPLILGGISIFASIVGSQFVQLPRSGWIMGALYKGLGVSVVVALPLFYAATVILDRNGEFGN